MRRQIVPGLSLCIALAFLDGCATVFNGYFDDVEVRNPTGSLRIMTADGVDVPLLRDTVTVRPLVEVVETNYIHGDSVRTVHFERRTEKQVVTRIRLRSKTDHVLVLEDQGRKKVIQVYGKIGAGWYILDTITGLWPVVVDALTGNWNSFDAIDASFSDEP